MMFHVCYAQVQHHYMVYVLIISSLATVGSAVCDFVYYITALCVSVFPVVSSIGTKITWLMDLHGFGAQVWQCPVALTGAIVP